jgi:hypothetical protein
VDVVDQDEVIARLSPVQRTVAAPPDIEAFSLLGWTPRRTPPTPEELAAFWQSWDEFGAELASYIEDEVVDAVEIVRDVRRDY